jgi:hypothetical protein
VQKDAKLVDFGGKGFSKEFAALITYDETRRPIMGYPSTLERLEYHLGTLVGQDLDVHHKSVPQHKTFSKGWFLTKKRSTPTTS